ncbi:MAG TPA: hypothetical protein VG055_29980 [Planctomycetaceae bacterium]|nr:hypothetical protein [Planctomycetaceae bacterium]
MYQSLHSLVMLAVVCVVLPAWEVCPAAEGRKEPARLDYYGDSLPPGAVARLGSTRFLLPGAVRALTFSRDGNTLASASHHVVMLWDRKTGRTIRQFPVDKFEVRAITFTDAGQILVLGGGHVDAWPTDKKDPDTGAYLFDPQTGRESRPFAGNSLEVLCGAFAPDGKSLATGSQEVCIWDRVTGQLVRRL